MDFSWLDDLRLQRWVLAGIAFAGAIVVIVMIRYPDIQSIELPLPISALLAASLTSLCLLATNLWQREVNDRIVVRLRDKGIKSKLKHLPPGCQVLIRHAYQNRTKSIQTKDANSASVLVKLGILHKVEAASDSKDLNNKGYQVYLVPDFVYQELEVSKYPWLGEKGNARPVICTYLERCTKLNQPPSSMGEYSYRVQLGLLYYAKENDSEEFAVIIKSNNVVYFYDYLNIHIVRE